MLTYRLLLTAGVVAVSLAAQTGGAGAAPLDRNTNPCVDFYQYACGGWLAANSIPADQSSWGRFSEVEERNLNTLRSILEKYSAADALRTPDAQRIGDHYAGCMDEKAVEEVGIKALQPELDRVNGMESKAALTAEVAHLHRIGVGVFFGFGSQQDFKDSTKVIAGIDQGGLGLPEREYYFKTDDQSVLLRKQYVEHVAKMFTLLGRNGEQSAKVVMDIETELAKSSLDIVTRRDPNKIYHKLSLQELISMSPGFRWAAYFDAEGAGGLSAMNVTVPPFFRAMESVTVQHSLDDLKTYLVWHLLRSSAPWLSKPFVEENFRFYGKLLGGAQELKPRWKRCVELVDGQIGEALGREFVDRTFGEKGKERTLRMMQALEKALEKDIQGLDWMTPKTKEQAVIKLHAIANKIGYPDKWRDYTKLRIVRGDLLGNVQRANEFEFERDAAKIGKPVNKQEWQMTPPTVDAYYDPQMNDINFPAGILQPPFFDNAMDDAVNFGAIGAIIGHELTHGFDDQGR